MAVNSRQLDADNFNWEIDETSGWESFINRQRRLLIYINDILGYDEEEEEFLMKLVTNLRGNLIRNSYRRSDIHTVDRQTRGCKTIAVISSFVLLYPRKVWRNERQCHLKLEVDGERVMARREGGRACYSRYLSCKLLSSCVEIYAEMKNDGSLSFN